MTPGERIQQQHQARLELGNLRQARQGDSGNGCAFCGCVLLVVLLVILLLMGALIGYGMWQQRHSHNSGLGSGRHYTACIGFSC
jgi:hypothetical protein